MMVEDRSASNPITILHNLSMLATELHQLFLTTMVQYSLLR